MSGAFVISTTHFTAGILVTLHKGLQFEASHSAMLPLQNRRFASPEAAREAVEKLMKKKSAQDTAVSFRRVC